MAMSEDMISAAKAVQLTERLRRCVQHHTALEEAIISCVLDFDLAVTATKSDGQADVLAQKLDELTMFEELTTGHFGTG